MRFGPEITAQEFHHVLRAELAATFGEARAQADNAQIDAAARALRQLAEVDLSATEEVPFFLGVQQDV